MERRAEILSELIDKTGLSRRAFAEDIGVPPTTLQSMLTRGIGKASIDNVIKVCKALGITVEELQTMADNEDFETIAAHHEGDTWTEEELQEIEDFKKFIKSKRSNSNDHQE